MAKAKTKYVCQECGYQTPKWMGRCPDCGAWNTLVEEVVAQPQEKKPGRAHLSPLAGGSTRPELLAKIDTTSAARIDTGIRELNRVLGGGLVPGELVLLSGDPGIGKSTLTMQLMDAIAGSGGVLYVSGEESKGQIRNRAERLGVTSERIQVMTENNVELLDAVVRGENWDLLIIDSVQTIFDPAVQSAPGSVSQLRAVTAACMGWAKGVGIPTVLIGFIVLGIQFVFALVGIPFRFNSLHRALFFPVACRFRCLADTHDEINRENSLWIVTERAQHFHAFYFPVVDPPHISSRFVGQSFAQV